MGSALFRRIADRMTRFEDPSALNTVSISSSVTSGLTISSCLLTFPYENPAATLDDLREAVTTLEDAGRIARRVFGGSHPTTSGIEGALQDAREVFRACETPSSPSGSA